MSFRTDGRFNLADLPYYLDVTAEECRGMAGRLDDAACRISHLETDEDPTPYIELLVRECVSASKLLKGMNGEFYAIRNEMALQEASKKLGAVIG